MLWHVLQELSLTLPASSHRPLVDPWYDLLSLSISSVRIGIEFGVPLQPLTFNVMHPSTVTACYEASTIPLFDFPRDLIANPELS